MTATAEETKQSPEQPADPTGLTRPNHVQKLLAVGIAAVAVAATSLIVDRVASTNAHTYSGSVTTQGVSNLNFTNRGRVDVVKVHAGSTVHKGDVLATQTSGATQALIAADNAAITSATQRVAALRAQVPNDPVAVSDAKGVLAHDQAELAQHRTQLASTQILAPEDGIVLAVNGQTGDVVDNDGVRQYSAVNSSGNNVNAPGFSLLPKGPRGSVSSSKTIFLPFVSLRTSNDWQVVTPIPEQSTKDAPVGADVDVQVPAADIKDAHGKVMQILPTPVTSGDSVSYQLLIKVAGNSGTPPLPGMTVDVTISK